MSASWVDELDREVRPWKPREDGPDRLIGVLKAVDTFDAGHGPYKVLTVEDEDGQLWSVAAFHEGLKRELRRLRPQVGEKFAVRYLGRKDLAGGKTFENYRVAVDRAPAPAPVVDWSTSANDDDDTPSEPGSQTWTHLGDNEPPF